MSVQSNGVLNLDVIDDAFGRTADLYRDVLQISQSAGPGQIHDAYFERRDQLYEALSSIDSVHGSHRTRREAEKQMDAVVCAIRVLGDPDLRSQYDGIRSQRIQRGKLGRKQQKSPDVPDLNTTSGTASTNVSSDSYEPNSRSVSYTMDSASPDRNSPVGGRRPVRITPEQQTRGRQRALVKVETTEKVVTPDKQPKVSKSFSPKSITDHRDDSSHSSASTGDDEGTMVTIETYGEPRQPDGFFDRMKAEIVGALDDTSRSIEQVFNAFTLREEDIQAVVGKIDRAKTLIRSGTVAEQPVAPPVEKQSGRQRSTAKSKSPTKSPTKGRSTRKR